MLGETKRDRQAERREATRREILDAAWAVAREEGLGQITLREVARRVGMQAPSLYTHFDSKNAIYDAMFGQAWTEALEVFETARAGVPDNRREAIRYMAHTYFDFAVADLARNQLMNLRMVPDFDPSPGSYAPSLAVLDIARAILAEHGISAEEDLDLYSALIGGLVDSQQANDPGGDRWGRLIDRAVDMFLDSLPPPES